MVIGQEIWFGNVSIRRSKISRRVGWLSSIILNVFYFLTPKFAVGLF